jgi:hypothetical protein
LSTDEGVFYERCGGLFPAFTLLYGRFYMRTPELLRLWIPWPTTSSSRSAWPRGVQQVEAKGRSAFLELAEGLGVTAREKIVVTDL